MASRYTKDGQQVSALSEMISISYIRDMQKSTTRYHCTAVATVFTNSGSCSLTKIPANCFQYIPQWTRSVSHQVLTSTTNGLYQGIYHFHNQIVLGIKIHFFFPFSNAFMIFVILIFFYNEKITPYLIVLSYFASLDKLSSISLLLKFWFSKCFYLH